MSIEELLTRSAPAVAEPNQEVQRQILARVRVQQMANTTTRQGWGLILYWLGYYLIRHPIPVLSLGYVIWFLSGRIDMPLGTGTWLSQFVHVVMSWR